MNSSDLSDHRDRRILGFSDTYGIDAGNGVARFLCDLRRLAEEHQLPLELVVPARDERPAGLIPIRAPAFTVPGYGELKVSMPLRHHRKSIERHIKGTRPDCIHVSTPGPFGCFGVTLARRFRIPLVGIYHTDFSGYVSAIIAAQLKQLRQNPQRLLVPAAAKILPLVKPLLSQLSDRNPRAMEDLSTIGKILERNLQVLSDDSRTDRYLASLAEKVATSLLRKFYTGFDLVVARSTEQQQTLATELNFDPERVKCLRPGTDIQRFHPRHADRRVWTQLGVPQDAVVVLYVGRITAEKNVGFLREVWAEVQAHPSQRDLHLVVVGQGEDQLTSGLQALPNTHVVGSQHGERLSRIYASADLFAFPSTTETLGQVGMEAGASGLPAMVADQGGCQMYVQHDETGWVLPTDHARVWVDMMVQVASNREKLRQMGSRARAHIADNFTLDHSLLSYWELHGEAMERRRRRLKTPLRARVRAKDLKHLKGMIPQQGVMVISDFHAGKHCGNPLHRAQKRAAIRAMLALAMERNLEVVFGGDFGDHGSRLSRLESDFEAFRSVREELGFDGHPVFVRGNHDYGYTDRRLEQLTGGCRVLESLVYYQPDARVTVCHGHIFGLARTLEVIRSSDNVPQLLGQLKEGLLDEDLKPAVIAYDIANMIDSGLADRGLRGLSTAWEGVYKYRATLAEYLLKLARNSNESDEATWKMIAGLVGTHDNVEVAAMLGVACGGWASLFGHTHEPLAKRRGVQIHEHSDRVAQIVGNAGHINRKRPTCAVAEFPQVTIFQFDAKLHRLRALRRSSLSEADINAFVQRGDSTRPAEALAAEPIGSPSSTRTTAFPLLEDSAARTDASPDRLPV